MHHRTAQTFLLRNFGMASFLLNTLFFILATVTSSLGANIALLVIDVQNCFLPGGSLAVKEGEQVIPVINDIRSKYENAFSLVVFSQDWHCIDHISFASEHPGKKPFDTVLLQYNENEVLCSNSSCNAVYNVTQTLWPDHCVKNTTGAEFSQNITQHQSDKLVRKGYNCKVDSYSAFFDNGGFHQTELDSILKAAKIDTVFVTGLALDYCVYYTSVDANKLGYNTYTIQDASRGVAKETTVKALADMRSKGVNVIYSGQMGSIIANITIPNPCTVAAIHNNEMYHPHPYDDTKFIKCDDQRKMYITQCPNGERYYQGSHSCGSTSQSVATGYKSPLEPHMANPCTSQAVFKHKYFFAYAKDNTRFIHCDILGGAWIMKCPPNLVWNQPAQSCIVNSQTMTNPCTKEQIARGITMFPHTDPHKYIHCDLGLNSWVQSCSPKTVFDFATQNCIWEKAPIG